MSELEETKKRIKELKNKKKAILLKKKEERLREEIEKEEFDRTLLGKAKKVLFG